MANGTNTPWWLPEGQTTDWQSTQDFGQAGTGYGSILQPNPPTVNILGGDSGGTPLLGGGGSIIPYPKDYGTDTYWPTDGMVHPNIGTTYSPSKSNIQVDPLARYSKVTSGRYKAYCSKCGNKVFPDNKWQISDGPSCHRGKEYVAVEPNLEDNKKTEIKESHERYSGGQDLSDIYKKFETKAYA